MTITATEAGQEDSALQPFHSQGLEGHVVHNCAFGRIARGCASVRKSFFSFRDVAHAFGFLVSGKNR